MPHFSIELARESDDLMLQEILMDNPMQSGINLSFRRSPSYFASIATEGSFNQVIVARDKATNNIAGFGTRSIRQLYINGKAGQLGYLNHLRLHKDFRSGTLVARGYRFFRQLHQDGRVPGYLTMIIEDNKYARRILTQARAGLPVYHDLGAYYSFVVPIPSRARSSGPSPGFSKGSPAALDEIIAFISANGAKKQFYPVLNKGDFIGEGGFLKDFSAHNFYLARENNEIVGVIAAWDQRGFKQTLISGYSGRDRLLLPLFNLGAAIFGLPHLPRPNQELNFFYASLICIKDNDPVIFKGLLEFIKLDQAGKGYSFMLLGLHSQDPLSEVLKTPASICFRSRAYFACWQDGEDFFRAIDRRVPYLELGTL